MAVLASKKNSTAPVNKAPEAVVEKEAVEVKKAPTKKGPKEKASDNFSYQNEVASAVANFDEEISIEMDMKSGIVLKYSTEINASQQLEVRLRTAAYEEDKRYVVESYRVTASEQGTEADFNDESIGWWQGN